VQQAGPLLRANVYGWFDRVERGVYELSPRGRQALAQSRASPSLADAGAILP
jgi:hypothetical protein